MRRSRSLCTARDFIGGSSTAISTNHGITEHLQRSDAKARATKNNRISHYYTHYQTSLVTMNETVYPASAVILKMFWGAINIILHNPVIIFLSFYAIINS